MIGIFGLVFALIMPTLGENSISITAWRTHVSPRLVAEWKKSQAGLTTKSSATQPQPNPNHMRLDSTGRVQVDVFHTCGLSIDKATFTALGFSVSSTVNVKPFCVIEGWVSFQSIPDIAIIPNVTFVDLPVYAHVPVPPTPHKYQIHAFTNQALTNGATGIDGAGVTIMQADKYVQQTGTNGTGVTVGIISDDATNLALIQSRGELPSNITKYPSGTNPSPTDEGTMMLEEVHAVAPGTTLAFCGPQTTAEYVSCLQSFATAHINIAADDLGFPIEDLMSVQSAFAQAVANILSSNPGLTLFSSSDNNNQDYWQGTYSPSTFTYNGGSTITCSANGQVDNYLENYGSQIYETLNLAAPLSNPIYLQWADPYGQNVSNFDLYILDSSFNIIACVPGAGSGDTFDAYVSTVPAGTYYLLIGTPNLTLSGKFLKLVVFADGIGPLSITTTGSVESPQKFITGVNTIGAVDGGDGIGNNIEPFSDTGPIQLEYPTPVALQAPIFVAPDDIDVDNVGTDFTQNPFFGTSAATPNAAAVAALLESSFKGAPNSSLLAYMQAGAVQLGGSVPNGIFGYGRADAIGALNAIAIPTISNINNMSIVGGQNSGPLPVTLTGVGNLVLSGSSNNTALVGFGVNGNVSISPASCGTTTNSCNLVVTPVIGQVGSAILTIQVNDGGNRTVSTNFTVTVTEPPAPTISGGSNQSVTKGSAYLAESVTLTGVQPLTVTLSSSNGAVVSSSAFQLSSGCGTSSLNCSVTISGTAGATGSSTITASVKDPYGQTSQTSFVLSATSPPSSGGGGEDPLLLLTLFLLLTIKLNVRRLTKMVI